MLVSGVFEINELIFTEKFLTKLDDNIKHLVFNNVYFEFVKKVLEKHGDKIEKGDCGRGENHFYKNFKEFYHLFSGEYIPLIYQDVSVGNINGSLELGKKKYSPDKGRFLFFAYCNNKRELTTFLRELKLCQCRKKKGSIGEAETGIVRLLVDGKIKEI